MNVKKIITLLLAFALTLSLAACGSKDDGKGDGDTQGATAVIGDHNSICAKTYCILGIFRI